MHSIRKGSMLASSLLLSFALLAAGCGNNGNNGSTGENAGQTNNQDANQPANDQAAGNNQAANANSGNAGAEKPLDPYEVVMIYPDGKQNDLAAVQTAMNDYLQKTYPQMNMTVKLNPIDWGAYTDKLNLMMSSGEKFDLLWTANWMNFETQVNKGALLPLDELVDQYGPDIKSVEGDLLDGAKRKGKLYGIHVHQELGNPQGIALRKDLVDKYHIDLAPLASGEFKDLEPILKTIKENEPSVTPAVGPAFPLGAYFGSGSMESIIGPVGLDQRDTNADNTYKVVDMYETPRYMELAKLTHDWYKAGYINKDATTPGVDIWKKIQAKTAFAAIGTDLEIVKDMAIGKPSHMDGKSAQLGMDIIQVPMNIDRLHTSKLSATLQAISQTSKDPARAMMLLDLFYKDAKLLTLFNYGVEGTHYALNNGQIDLPQGKTKDNVGFYHDNQWQLGNQMLNFTRLGEDPNKYQNYEQFNEMVKSQSSPIIGFVFDSEPVKNELIAVGKVQSTYDPGLQSGQLDPEKDLPKMIDKLKAAGLDKIISEAQKQIDEWRAANGK
ncbi:ABC transporter substrate-binding protein [Paenibacillus sacheonensis]|uniref:Extracellular solute-binding protein n=1 Tax=Paenibacillus sacheonensis TaxID=742054 RepID=A0A7X4YTU6_9BACL|nr:ABC transporter substrate-binding protein [Paenibacillus sacheonensis]MBM7568651.1 putative aldouronate transport system substrate-binding protein [Paenibacillus sacheonensis]NBC72458.1 extracellular solute-binding protein [Paenibacillus sacheonensis]